MDNGLFKTETGAGDRCEITHDSCTLARCDRLQASCGAYAEETLQPGKYMTAITEALEAGHADTSSELGDAVLVCKKDIYGKLLGYLGRRKP